MWMLGLTCLALCIFLLAQQLYIRNVYFKPFYRLEEFAQSVAAGGFEIPLPMDRKNVFGAFTEGFDLMRSELLAAREKAAELEKAKSEMTASLSHDIKTPVSSIIAISDFLMLMEADEEKLKKLKGINIKAEEIDTLITNLFQTTLEDLSELSVVNESTDARTLKEMIRHGDFLGKVRFQNDIPECLVDLDPVRIGQVFSNRLVR